MPPNLQKMGSVDDHASNRPKSFFDQWIDSLFGRGQNGISEKNRYGLRDRYTYFLQDAAANFNQLNFRLNSKEANQIDHLKKMLLLMASNAEQCVQKAVHSLVSRDQASALSAKEQDSVIDQLEKDVDELAMKILTLGVGEDDLRFVAMAMKISTELERVGDEATTLSRRSLELMKEEPLKPEVDIQRIAEIVVEMLKAALDAFVYRRPDEARRIILKDKEVDRLNKSIYKAMTQCMISDSGCVTRCLHYITISKSFERIGDHASNIAEEVVFLCEARDIRHEHTT